MFKKTTTCLQKYSFVDLGLDRNQVANLINPDPSAISEDVSDLITEALKLAEGCCVIEGGYVVYDSPRFDLDQLKVHIGGVDLLIGKIIIQQIVRSSKVAVFLCTAGHRIGDCYAKELMNGNFLYSSVIESVITLAIERAIEKIQENLLKSISGKNIRLTNRFSPGFCNWDISEQKQLISLLPPGFMNVKLMNGNILDPVQSITGIIGIGNEVKRNEERCEQCTTVRCQLRKAV